MIHKYLYIFVVLSLLFSSAQADALVLLQQASVLTEVEYDTNPTITSNQKQAIWRYTVSPKYTVSAADDRTRWFATGGLYIQRSSNNAVSADRQDPAVTAGWEYQFQKSVVNITANYNKASSRLNEFNNTGIIDIDGTVVSKSISASWVSQLTERLSLSVGSQYLKKDYSASRFSNSNTKYLNSTLTY